MTQRALEAADRLGKDTSIGVLHVPTIKPFDGDAVAAFAASVTQLVVAENHVASGGLASLVAEALFDRGVVKPLRRIGLPDRFIECGSVPHLQDRYGLSTDRVVEVLTKLG
jgi:transketolase